MASEKILVVGGGLSGLSIAYYLSQDTDVWIVESQDHLGGFFLHDDLEINGVSPSKLVNNFIEYIIGSEAVVSTNTSGIMVNNELYVVGGGLLERWCGPAVAATGFRSKIPIELNILGYRPAGIFSLEMVIEMLSDGYIPGENIIVYGFNRYVASLIYRLQSISLVKSLKIIIDGGESDISHYSFIDRGDIEVENGRITWVDGVDRVKGIRLDDGRYIYGDTLIIGKIMSFNYLGLNYSVGNASMLVYDPLKIVELSKVSASNLLDLINGGEILDVEGNVMFSPKRVSRNIRRVMMGYPKDTVLEINGIDMVLHEDYEVITLPDEDVVNIRVIN